MYTVVYKLQGLLTSTERMYPNVPERTQPCPTSTQFMEVHAAASLWHVWGICV